MIRVIVHVAAVVFLLFAAFRWFADAGVIWLYLGLAAWCASMLPWSDWGIPARRRSE